MSTGGGSPSKRRDTDLMRLMMSDLEVHIPDESSMHDFLVAFPGPEDTPYEGGEWAIQVRLPPQYPFKSPSIGFDNRIFHPNVDEISGSVCLDVINQTWSPMFDLVNVFKMFLPQLLRYPNPADPLNSEAAALMMSDPEGYTQRIRESVRLHASTKISFGGGDCAGEGAGAGTEAGAPGAGQGHGGRGGREGMHTAPPSSTGSSQNVGELDMDDAASDVSDLSDIE